MKIFNGTTSTMNVPMANGSRLVIRPFETSKQFLPTTELLQLFVSAYSRDDIALIIESSAEISMGSLVSALPGYVANSVEEAVIRFRDRKSKWEDSMKSESAQPKKPQPVKVEKPQPVAEAKPTEEKKD